MIVEFILVIVGKVVFEMLDVMEWVLFILNVFIILKILIILVIVFINFNNGNRVIMYLIIGNEKCVCVCIFVINFK